jgi:hemerythrin
MRDAMIPLIGARPAHVVDREVDILPQEGQPRRVGIRLMSLAMTATGRVRSIRLPSVNPSGPTLHQTACGFGRGKQATRGRSMTIMWREGLTIDQGPIDQDHHTLIAIINKFETVEPGPAAAAGLADVIRELEQYGSTHFAREERLQRLVGFPFAEAHSHQHRHLMRSLKDARAELARTASGKDLAVFREHMCGFLNDWLIDHIIRTDLTMKPYVKAMAPHAELLGSLHAAVRAMTEQKR